MKNFKLKIGDGHLRVFAGRNPPNSDLFIYVFTNRKLINNMQSGLEFEVFKWVDADKEGKCKIVNLEEGAEFHDRPIDPGDEEHKVRTQPRNND